MCIRRLYNMSFYFKSTAPREDQTMETTSSLCIGKTKSGPTKEALILPTIPQ